MESAQPPSLDKYWSLDTASLTSALRLVDPSDGLSQVEAAERIRKHGANDIVASRPLDGWRVLLNQVRSPLVLLLVFAGVASIVTGDFVDAAIVIAIVVVSSGVGFFREYRAQTALQRLRSQIRRHTTVVRDGALIDVPTSQIVPGDVVQLSAGSLVPADAVVIEATDFYVNQAMLTGESFPVSKVPGPVAADTSLAARSNCVFLGTNVRTGTANCVVVNTGASTQFGGIAARLSLRSPETEFEHGIRRFGYLLTIVMLIMVLVVFAVNVFLNRPALDTLLFAIALAVGLTPELLPAILNVNLARSAEAMSRLGVLVRHLNAIENLGSMDVLCTDKTGTLTEGMVRLDGAYDPQGNRSEQVLELASLNSRLQTGLNNPLDDAILNAHAPAILPDKLAEIPYDFVRKRMSVVIERAGHAVLITKGAFEHVLEASIRLGDGASIDDVQRNALRERFDRWSCDGTRVLALATRDLPVRSSYGREDERDLTFIGFLSFLDKPKAGAVDAIRALGALGVSLKMITGDTSLVAQSVARDVGMRTTVVLTGSQLDELSDESLWHVAESTDLFVEVDPNQKERIILALKKTGHVVGFLGDGVNDAPAMHAADTSLSVNDAVDVAREAADFVLLERDLDVIRRGVVEGRRTFANTLKYILTTTSANLGNMLSMAAASLFLPFLPLTAGQILLNNFLSDIPAIGLANDNVDKELIDRPRRWNMPFIARFMVGFGALSSLFDLMTFIALLAMFGFNSKFFRTGWFLESLLTELVVALVVRTRRSIFKSAPGRVLVISTIAVALLALAIVVFPVGTIFGFTPLPAKALAVLVAITVLYVSATELLKSKFYAVAEPWNAKRHARQRRR